MVGPTASYYCIYPEKLTIENNCPFLPKYQFILLLADFIFQYPPIQVSPYYPPIYNLRPKMEKSQTKCHQLLFGWIFSGLVQQKQSTSTELNVKRGVRGVQSANSRFLGGIPPKLII